LGDGIGTGDCFVVEGGVPLSGTVVPAGNKNEALPALAATLLCPGSVTLTNVPDIRDVATSLALIESLGASVSRPDTGVVRVDAAAALESGPDPRMAAGIRGSFLLAPALLHRRGEAVLPQPGGDRIGRRRIDTHLLALKLLGARVALEGDSYHLTLDGRFRGGDVFLDEASVMATENAVMAASVAEGHTRILNAASEPHVQGLCQMLAGMGARIDGIGTNCLEIDGAEQLGPVEHRIGPDHIEIGSFVAIAGMTGGELRIEGVVPGDLRMIRMVFSRLGVETTLDGQDLFVPGGQELVIRDDIQGAIPKVDDAPWPGFPADLTSLALVVATQARGMVLIHEKLFESRLFFVDRLITMGARVVLCDPHRAVVSGPTPLHGATMASPDIRAGMALLAAALCAEGTSVIMNAAQVDRGYENVDARLRSLGARIERRPTAPGA
jgi:UDP-N-acetylglucosamine 1-carboxyvinyltransferase